MHYILFKSHIYFPQWNIESISSVRKAPYIIISSWQTVSFLAIIFDGAVMDAKCILWWEPARVRKTHLESSLLFSLGKGSPSLTGPPFWLSLISQERKITDFRVLRLGLPLFFPFPLKMWHSLEKKVPNGICVPCFPTLSPSPCGTCSSGRPSLSASCTPARGA